MATLVSLNTPDPVRCAAGQYQEIRCRFLYSLSVIGKDIVFSPGLWFDNPVQILGTTAPANNVFKATYPSTGTVEMTWYGNEVLENWHAEIEYVDAFTFDVILKFISTTDLNKFVHDSPGITNQARFVTESLALSSVYNQNKHAIFAVWIEDDIDVLAQINFPYQGNNWFGDAFPGTFQLTVNSVEVDGFIVGQDLDVLVHIDASSENVAVGGEYYVGIFKDEPDASGNLVDAHDLGYAYINGITPQAVDDLDNPFISSTPILLTQGLGISNQYEGQFTVETGYFNPDYCYRVYVVYSIGGAWYSAKSDAFCLQGAPNVPTYGTITPAITHGENEYAGTGCVSNVSPGTTLTFCAIMDADEYNTNALTNGVPGTYDTNLEVINVYDSLENLQPGQNINEITGLTFLGESADGCYDLTIPTAWSGTNRYIIFEYVFLINDDPQYRDYIYWAFPISIIDIETTPLTVVLTDVDDAEFTNGLICLDYDDIIKATITHADGAAFNLQYIDPHGLVLSAAEDFQPSGEALITIDANQLILDVDRCIKIIATATAPGTTTCDCFNIELTQSVTTTENGISEVALAWEVLLPPSPFQSIIIKQGTNPAEEFTDQSGTTSYQIVTNGATITLNYLIVVILENGCSYTTSATIQVFNVEGASNTLNYDICEDAPDGLLDCDNYPVITWTCAFDEANQIITPTFESGQVSSPIDTDTKEYSLNNGATWLPYVSGDIEIGFLDFALIRWTLTFSDGCQSVVVVVTAVCPRTPPDCNNVPKMTCSFDPDTDTFTVTTSINGGGSDVSDWHIQYSEDGGLTFDDYTAPFIVAPEVDSIIVIANPEYTDGCPDGPVLTCQWVRDEDAINCDYSDYELTSEFDPGTGAHIPTFTGDEDILDVNIKEYSTDGGLTWTEYLTNPIGQLVIFRWTIQFEGCCEEILVSASQEPQIGPTMFRIVDTQIDVSALGAPQATFTLNVPPGYELINSDHVIPYLNNARLFEALGDYGWTVNTVTNEITYDTAFDPAEFPTETYLIHEYWVRSI